MGILPNIATNSFRHDVARCLIGGLSLVFLTAACYRLRLNVATASLLYVMVVVLLSWVGSLISSIIVSIIAALCLAHLAPPVHSFRVNDPLDVVAIIAFLTASLSIARLVSKLQKAKEEALSSVNRRLVDSEEKQRARLARDLHDDIGQRLALLVNNLGKLKQNSAGCPTEVRDCVAELYTETFKIASDIQVLSDELHPPNLELVGLETTMRSFCREFGQQQKCDIDFRSHFQSPPPTDISVALFRVLQEALHNTAKHSGARHVEVQLWEAHGEIHLIVRDLGLGFDPEAAVEGRGLGLISMRERMKMVDGTFSIDSQAQHGATIHASVPLPPRRASG